MEPPRRVEAPHRSVLIWLWAVYAMICAMVTLGGITRLTGSGLSMVEWRPLMGALPPLGEAGWQEVFAKYKQTPQYVQVNDWMTLADFKRIFFWEYLHRLFGRSIGLVFIVPWIVLLARGRLRGRLAIRTVVAFVLGGLQGALGWYMVKSGLVDVPAVSHYRLAAHLSLAFFVGCWILWILFDLHEARAGAPPGAPAPPRWPHRSALALLGLVGLQIVFGAFMAGTRAGYLYPTFPTMAGRYFPRAAFAMDPLWINFFENMAGIHWMHRMLGYLVVAAAVAFSVAALRAARTARQRAAAKLVTLAALVQVTLGILTVLLRVPIALAAAHQLGGLALTSVVLFAAHAYRPAPQEQERRAGATAAAPVPGHG
ncbi:MAG: COX15/CtaA family protein [Polyangiaceae bacterium]|nr:COX15/CtaA family protein [Polyangiaceae bacterium]